MEAPIRYARLGDVHIAYRIFGDGPRDIVLIPGTLSHVERLSDRIAEQTLEERIRDWAR
jgi:hypothetical protein